MRESLCLKHHQVPEWVILYCTRWLQAPMAGENNELQARIKGTPQGGVISPLLANLFLHYAFDVWMERENTHIPFERYADDIVCHSHRMSELVRLKELIQKRMQKVGLSINEGKSNIAYFDPAHRERHKKR